jgi:hypothetical protein
MINKSKKILSEISVGELLDKISILEIKLNKIKNLDNQKEISKEHKILKKAKNLNIKETSKIKELNKKLKIINLRLWNIEDKIRICEKNKNFGKKFVALARSVYSTNDKRSQIKLEINQIAGSNIKEIKQYVDY